MPTAASRRLLETNLCPFLIATTAVFKPPATSVPRSTNKRTRETGTHVHQRPRVSGVKSVPSLDHIVSRHGSGGGGAERRGAWKCVIIPDDDVFGTRQGAESSSRGRWLSVANTVKYEERRWRGASKVPGRACRPFGHVDTRLNTCIIALKRAKPVGTMPPPCGNTPITHALFLIRLTIKVDRRA
jgi:hypothetical protein